MKVFVVSFGECRGGGSVQSVHATAEGARARAIALVAEADAKNKVTEEALRSEGVELTYFESGWKESSHGFWSDGLDWISVIEYEVKS